MFHFPAFPPPPYTRSDDGGPAQPGPGSPIRTPPDQSSLANSPGHIAGRNVLHQLLVPRHPPNAPQNHTQQKTRPRPPPQNGGPAGHTPPHTPHGQRRTKQEGGTRADNKDARNHYTNHKQPTTTTTTPAHDQDPAEGPNPTHPPPKQEAGRPPRRGPQPPHQGRRRHPPTGGPRVLDVNPTARPSAHSSKAPMPNPTTRTRPTSTLPAEPTRPQAPRHHQPPTPRKADDEDQRPGGTTTGLPRKEVIQPHLPVRLPCYDFVPIADPTFDHSPRTSRLGHGLRALPTFVT